MDIALVTDEVSADLDTALELARAWGVEHVEIRGVGDGRYPRVGDALRALTPRLVREHGVRVVALSPGLFKQPYPDADGPLSFYQWSNVARAGGLAAGRAALEDQLERLLPESIEAALELDCPVIGCFAFSSALLPLHREMLGLGEEIPEGVVEVLREAARRCAASGLVLAIENEMTTYATTAAVTAELIRRVDEPNVGIVWDPANAYLGGDATPFPDAYAAVKGLVRLVHFKDVRFDDAAGRREFCVEGEIDWAGQVAALRADGYDGAISVETHMRPKVAPSRALVERLRGLLAGGS